MVCMDPLISWPTTLFTASFFLWYTTSPLSYFPLLSFFILMARCLHLLMSSKVTQAELVGDEMEWWLWMMQPGWGRRECRCVAGTAGIMVARGVDLPLLAWLLSAFISFQNLGFHLCFLFFSWLPTVNSFLSNHLTHPPLQSRF